MRVDLPIGVRGGRGRDLMVNAGSLVIGDRRTDHIARCADQVARAIATVAAGTERA